MSKYVFFLVSLLGVVAIPSATYAAVLISEVAWMGTNAATNGHYCEWIELQNTGEESVSLSGWKLKTLDAGMNITLSGSIPSGAFFVVERYTANACPDPVPNRSDLSVPFGSGLANTGEVLILLQNTSEIDRIDASEGWEGSVGGDPDRKLSAQRNGDEWVTAEPTPGAVNATVSLSEPEVSSGSSSSEKIVANPIPELYIVTGGDRVVSVDAHVPYVPLVYGSDGRARHHARVSYAFGDGGYSTGTRTMYAYREPGEYLVVVRAEEGYSTGVSSFTVIADTADITISSVTEKGIALRNDDSRILDLSQYQLTTEGKTFRIPTDTQILPGRTVIFPPEVTGLATSARGATLRYPSGEEAVVYKPLQPIVSETGTNTVSTPITTPGHEETTPAPPATAIPGVGGALPLRLLSLVRDLWPQPSLYRTLSSL